jgi:hypothetical protein
LFAFLYGGADELLLLIAIVFFDSSLAAPTEFFALY